MYNDNIQSPPPTDYLNQISPTSPKKLLVNKKIMILIIIGVILTLVVIILAIIAGSISGNTKPIQTLSARLNSTAATVTLADQTIKSSKLRALNSNLNIYLSNTIRDLAPIIVSSKVDTKKPNLAIEAAESNVAMLAILEDARLNAVYDRVYAREMNTQLEKILLLMAQINSTSKIATTKTFLDSAITNLDLIQKQFADFN